MRATLVIASNPFDLADGRRVIELRRRTTLATAARKHRVDLDRPVVCSLNGEWYLRREWRRTVIEDGAVVAFITIPQGRGGSNPLALVLTIGLMVFAPAAGAALFGAGTIGAQIAGGVIALGGSMLISALLPPPRPPTPQIQAALAAPSPTYTLTGQGNMARLNQAIPLAYGRNRMVPDLAADPYTEFAGNEQILYQLYCVGIGRFAVEQILIEDTTVATAPAYGTFAGAVFPDLTCELVPPGGTVTLFPARVVSSAEVAGQKATHNVPLGPFVVNGPGPENWINAIGVDSVATKGAGYANDAGGIDQRNITWRVEAQAIDDGGFALGPWVPLGHEEIAGATTTPQRVSNRYNVETGRYRVQYIRTNPEDTDSRAFHELVWFGLRGYCPGSQQYGQVTMLAMRARASNALSGLASRQLKMIATRVLPVRINGAWQPEQPTRSIAWAAADMCRAVYAGERPDSEISLAELDALDVIWQSRGDYFDGVFDQGTDFWEALQLILRAGRAKPFSYGSAIHFWRHQPQALPTQLLTMRNTRPGTFSRERITIGPDEADAVEIEYWDEATWAPDYVMCALPGVTPVKPAKVKLFGVGQRAHAWREGMYMAAMHRYARLQMSIATELEGQINLYGDLVALSNVRLRRSRSGDVVAVAGLSADGIAAGAVVTLSEAVEFTPGVDHYIGFRGRNGQPVGPVLVTPGQDEYHVVLGQPVIGWQPYTATDMERSHFAFGAAGAYWQLARVESMRPRGSTVELSLVNEDPRMHTADGGVAPGADPRWDLPTVPTVPVIPAGSLQVTLGGTAPAPTAVVSWAPAAGATHYMVEISTDALNWTRVAEPTGPPVTIAVPAGDVWIRVAPVGAATGPWVVTFVSVSGDLVGPVPPVAPTALVAYGMITGVLLNWADYPSYKQMAGVQILRGTVYDLNAAQVIDTPNAGPAPIYFDATGTTGQGYWYWIRYVNLRGQVGAPSNGGYAVTGRVSKSDVTWSDSGNQIANSDFANASLANWGTSIYGGSGANCNFGVDLSPDWTLRGGHTAYAYQGNTDPNTVMDIACEQLACQPGIYVEAGCRVGAHRCTVQIHVAWFNAGGTFLTSNLVGQIPQGPAGGREINGYAEAWAILQAPAGAVSAAMILRKLGTLPGHGDSYAFYTHPQLRIATSASQVEHSPYTPGPTGAVRGDLIPDNEIRSNHIPDDTILARHILAWQITAGKIAANALVVGDAVMSNAYVDTLKIKNQAVTIEVSSYSEAETFTEIVGAGLQWVWGLNVQSASIVSEGYGPIQIRISFQWKFGAGASGALDGQIKMRLLRNGAHVWDRVLPTAAKEEQWGDIFVEILEPVLPAGPYTYSVQIGASISAGFWVVSTWARYRYVALREGKR